MMIILIIFIFMFSVCVRVCVCVCVCFLQVWILSSVGLTHGEWMKIPSAVEWTPRFNMASTVWGSSLLIAGGDTSAGSGLASDMYQFDGLAWHLVTLYPAFSGRSKHKLTAV